MAPNIPNQEDVIVHAIGCLRGNDSTAMSAYGYDVYVPRMIDKWIQDTRGLSTPPTERGLYATSISSVFYDATWELCRIGILRPGIRSSNSQSTQDGSAGNGYSITPFGKQWLKESGDNENFVPTEPGRFSEMLAPFTAKFGPGFGERASQAVRSYGAHTYLACCAMCGAAAESILLHLAIAKDGDEGKVLGLYRAANGRKRLEDILVGKQKNGIKGDFETCFSLLKYWRDEAAHGCVSGITESEAFTSLALLLRCAKFAMDNFDPLTAKEV